MIDLEEQVVVINPAALIRIFCGTGDRVGMGASTTGDKIDHTAMFVALVVMHVPGKDYETRVSSRLPIFKKFRERVLLRSSSMTFAEHGRRGTCIRGMMHHEENEIDVGGDVVEFALQPLALRTRELIQRTIQDEEQRVGGADRIVAAVLQVWKVAEIITESDLLISVKLVVAERRKSRDVLLMPDTGFAVVDFPVIGIGTFVNDVAGEADECGAGISDCTNQRRSHNGVRGFGVVGVMEAGVSIGNEAKRNGDVDVQIGGQGLGSRSFRAGNDGE